MTNSAELDALKAALAAITELSEQFAKFVDVSTRVSQKFAADLAELKIENAALQFQIEMSRKYPSEK